ncbi:transposase tnpA, partial [mine drainage metagenome]
MLDLSAATLDGKDGLVEALQGVPEHRKLRGIRHPLASILSIATCATLAGARSMAAVGEYAQDCPQEVLARLGAKYHPEKKRYIAPHHDTIQRALSSVDTAALDRAVGAWLYDQVVAGNL